MHFGDLPLDLIRTILKVMSPTDLLNAGLASHGLAEIAIDSLPTTRSVKIGVSHDGLRASYEGDGEAEIQVPMTIKKETKRILEILLPRLATAAESLNLENGMIGDEISDDQFAHLLQLLKEAPLKELTLSEIDLQRIRSWTLAMLAGFDRLEKIEIEECKLGGETEAMLLKSLQCSFKTLAQIDLKGTPQITDHFAHRVSRNCPNLSYFRISDCPLVTTLTALQFIESASYRSSDKLDMHMDNTEFDAEKLLFFIKNPCFESSYSNWSLQQVLVPIAYDKPAYLALHQSRKCVLIFV